MIPESARLTALRSRTATMVEHLGALVGAETPSEDIAACAAGAAVVQGVAEDVLGDTGERVEVEGRVHLRWAWPAADRRSVLLLGHYDTVWPVGTLARWPFSTDQAAGTATGPGCFDMKAGIVQLFHAVASLEDRAGLEILLTCDEEIGSFTSRSLIEGAARRSAAALVFEASAKGALKVGRKGAGMYQLRVTGVAAHAGLEPEKGANALIELAHLLVRVDGLSRPEAGTTVTATMASSGTATNTVPAAAEAHLDVRYSTPEEGARVAAELSALRTTVPGTSLEVTGGLTRPPMPRSTAETLFEIASTVSGQLQLPEPAGVVVGGASDGNFTAGAGCPTLDGLGAVGDGAHAEGEYVRIAAMPERAALAAGMLERLR